MLLYATASDLMLRFRRDVFDPLEGIDATEPDSENLWKNEDVFDYMTEAVDAVARYTKSLTKSFSIPFVAGQAVVRLPSSVLDILPESMSLANGKTRIYPANTNDTPYGVSDDYGNRSVFLPLPLETGGTPSRYIRDYEAKGNLRLVPIPQVADTLSFIATVTLSYPFQDGTEPLPFTEMPDIALILKYMKYLAYRKQDADVVDLQRSDKFRAEFEADVVERESEIRRIRRPFSRVRAAF